VNLRDGEHREFEGIEAVDATESVEDERVKGGSVREQHARVEDSRQEVKPELDALQQELPGALAALAAGGANLAHLKEARAVAPRGLEDARGDERSGIADGDPRDGATAGGRLHREGPGHAGKDREALRARQGATSRPSARLRAVQGQARLGQRGRHLLKREADVLRRDHQGQVVHERADEGRFPRKLRETSANAAQGPRKAGAEHARPCWIALVRALVRVDPEARRPALLVEEVAGEARWGAELPPEEEG
jgi:hypothetical protein